MSICTRFIVGCSVVLAIGISPVLAGEKACISRTSLTNEILVLDPGVDPKGEPHPLLQKDGDGLIVTVPPTVHIHRYFPSSSREFQAQYFAGGPTIVSVRHPYTSEQVNVQLDLPPGFPKVRYGEDEIQYKYPEETVTIHFPKCGEVSTSRSHCGAGKTKAKECATKIKTATRDCGEKLGINEVGTKLGQEAKEKANGAVELTGGFVKKSGELLVAALKLVPGSQLVQSKAEDQATKYRDRGVQRASRERDRAEADINTLR